MVMLENRPVPGQPRGSPPPWGEKSASPPPFRPSAGAGVGPGPGPEPEPGLGAGPWADPDDSDGLFEVSPHTTAYDHPRTRTTAT